MSQILARVPVGVWVVLLSLPALVPLGWVGFFDSHDGLFHIYRLGALDHAVRAGVLYPRWFPEFAFGYGHPVLNFYGPLSYYWGLPFTLLGAGAVLAMKATLATGLVASALGMYLFARLHLDRGPAFVAAMVYTYLPYHLTDLYVRGAVAEFLAFVWFPLLLWALHRLVEDSEGRVLIRLALVSLLSVALVVTHSLSAFIFAPVSAGYVVFLLWRGHNWRAIGRVATALVLAAALSAFYWVPVLFESRYVGLGHGASQGYQDHLLRVADLISLTPAYDYSNDPAAPITYPLGLVQVAILVTALALLFRFRQRRPLAVFFLAVAFFSIFMFIDVSLPVWQILEAGMTFLQYPWRFQALTLVATAVLAGALWQGLVAPGGRGRLALGSLLLLLTGIWALWSLPIRQTLPDLSVEGMWRNDQVLGQVGSTWTGEYLPVWVKEQRWAISHPAPEPSPGDNRVSASSPRIAKSRIQLTGVGFTRYDLTLDAPQGASLALHQFYYPGWQATWQGDTVDAYPRGDLGLVAFELPPGSGQLIVRLAPTPAQAWGTALSLVASLAVGILLIAQLWLPRPEFERSSTPRTERALWAVLVACYLLLAVVLLASLVLPNGYVRATNPVNANLEDVVELQAFLADANHHRPGDTVEVTLYWMALNELDQDYKTFIHLTDADVTRQPTQHDDDPGGDFTPTTRWLPGELVPDTHYLTLPVGLAPGRYNIWADMYEFPTVRNLKVLSAEAPTDGNRVLLSEIQVIAP